MSEPLSFRLSARASSFCYWIEKTFKYINKADLSVTKKRYSFNTGLLVAMMYCAGYITRVLLDGDHPRPFFDFSRFFLMSQSSRVISILCNIKYFPC